MIYIATSLDEPYYRERKSNWIESVQKNKSYGIESMMIQLGFNDPTMSTLTTSIPIESIKYSRHTNTSKRGTYICLESGEFVDFINFQSDDDIVILTDWDVTLQRPFTQHEIDIINNLGSDKFGMTLDNYTSKNTMKGYLGIDTVFSDVDPTWKVYNAGVQIAKVSAWKLLYSIWKELIPTVHSKMNSHAAGQALFNYIINKHDMLTEIDPIIHNAHWYEGTPARINNNQLVIGSDLVLFNHHKFQYKPKY